MHNVHQKQREEAIAIWQAGVQRVQPRSCLPAAMLELAGQVHDWSPERQYLVIGGGKAGAAMAATVEQELLRRGVPAARISGWVNVPAGSSPSTLKHIHLHVARPAGYNFPTAEAVAGTQRMLALLDQAPQDAVVLCLISGGGSAILCAPVPEVPLEDKILVSKQLSAAGASIGELNAVRKHLSAFKGGRLAQRALTPLSPGGRGDGSEGATRRQLISMILSDVIGDPLDVIASGPTAVDTTTYTDALEVLQRYDLMKKIPQAVIKYLQSGAAGKHPETLKQVPAAEPQLIQRIVASNRIALEAAGLKARSLGYEVIDQGDAWAGDTLELASRFAEELPDWKRGHPVCVLSGGETTVKLPEKPGKGGRNQSMALAMLQQLQTTMDGVTLLCAGTDGEDGPTDAAGAIADEDVLVQSRGRGMNMTKYLASHNAYPFFEATGGLFKTGLTDTNVMDLRVFLIHTEAAT